MTDDKKRIEEIRVAHSQIANIKSLHLNFVDHISRWVWLEYIEGTSFLLTQIDKRDVVLRTIRSTVIPPCRVSKIIDLVLGEE